MMRNAWKELYLRGLPHISSRASRLEPAFFPVRIPQLSNSTFVPPLSTPVIRWFSSGPVGLDEIKTELDSLDLSFNQDTMDLVLRDLRGLHSASEDGCFRLNSKAYNRILETLGNNGHSDVFWRVVLTMRKKGYGISKNTFLALSKSFAEEKMEKDAILLKEAYALSSTPNEAGRLRRAICNILSETETGELLQQKLDESDINLSSELVTAVLESTNRHADKALLFFEWVNKKASFKVDSSVYHTMARILSRKDYIVEFHNLLQEMRAQGYELEEKAYAKVLNKCLQHKNFAGAADLYEFAMGGSEKPLLQDFIFLLEKIVVSKHLDFNSITRIVRVFVADGNYIGKSVIHGVLQSLRRVGRMAECSKVLKAMEEGGYSAESSIHDQVVIGLCDVGKLDESLVYSVNIENEGYRLDSRSWRYIVEKNLAAGRVEQALSSFKIMLEQRGGENVACAFEVIVKGLCEKNRAKDAHKILKDMVSKNNLLVWHSTYKLLIENLIRQGHLEEAASLFGLMKAQGFPPFIDPFILHMSKSGTVDDAMGFLKAMTVKEFPSKIVFVRLFETLLKAGRHEVAHGILSKSPGSVRNHADVLDLFYSLKPVEASATVA